ncbi:MAG TPA: metabolite traffic protein EboE [Longimicrobiaceae bacterium]
MKPDGAHSPHLTYCTNIHPGESWAQVRANFDRYVLPIREQLAPDRPFGLGLRLSAEAARELAAEDTLAEFRTFLDRHRLYVFTLNGFPYGPFHGQPVKEEVYLPNWMQPERLAYTDELASLLETLLPDGVDGTISTVPGAFAPLVAGGADVQRMAEQMARHAAHLHRIHERSGRHIALALEPEPCCYLETVAETVAFFQEELFGPRAVATLREEIGGSAGEAERLLREHLTVCFDACHMAVEFEEPGAALAAFESAGIRIGKYQISAGLRLRFSGDAAADAELRRALEEFADPVYLHQVVERGADGRLRRFLDLPEALRAAARDTSAREWRIHFHVPLFREELGPFQSTQPYLKDLIGQLADGPGGAHWEVETYTWDVLPPEFRGEGVVTAVVRELRWVLEQMGSRSSDE